MLIAVAVVALAAAQSPCGGEAAGLLTEASGHAAALDLPRAAARLEEAAETGCEDARIAALYIRGLADAREAYSSGAPPAALVPVREAIASLETIAGGRPGPAEIARLVLHAAAAAAQSERDELGLYLDAALRMEALQRLANQPGAPIVPALEVAGDLWLQVHWFAEARRAYTDAVDEIGLSPRVVAGLARAAARLGDVPAACAGYRLLLDVWGMRTTEPPAIADARAYLLGTACQPAAAP